MKRLLTAIAAAVLTATACAAPANDNFANATPISGVEGSITGTTAGATLEPGELNGEMDGMPVKTVWFKWTAPADVTTVAFYIDTVAGYYEPAIVAAAGNAVDKLDYEVADRQRVFLLDDYYVYAFVTADVTPGQTYHIVVASVVGDMDFRLAWKAGAGFSPVVDDGILLGFTGECPETLYIPNTVTWIAEEVFENCDNLYSVIFSESVAGIGSGAFAMCSNLSDLTFNKGMSVIEDEAFATCNGLAGETLRLPWFLKKATGNAFPGIYNGDQPNPSALTVEAPESVQDTLYSGWYNEEYDKRTELTVNYFNYSTDGLVNMKLHPEGGEFNRGLRLSMVDKIGDYGSTIVEMWKNKADWNDAISRKPTKDGYMFDGFWTAPDGGKQIWDADMKYVKGTGYWSTDGKWMVSSTTMDAYAHWAVKMLTVSFNATNGKLSGSRTKTVQYNKAYGTLPTATQAGYDFLGWFTERSGGTQVTADTKMTTATDHTLYSHWKKSAGVALALTTGGDAAWTQQADGTWRSGKIGDRQETWLRAEVFGPGTLTFRWKVLSEKNYDWLRFSVDDDNMLEASGTDVTTVSTKTVEVTGAGRHLLIWFYLKDGSNARGSDAAWISQIKWTPK